MKSKSEEHIIETTRNGKICDVFLIRVLFCSVMNASIMSLLRIYFSSRISFHFILNTRYVKMDTQN